MTPFWARTLQPRDWETVIQKGDLRDKAAAPGGGLGGAKASIIGLTVDSAKGHRRLLETEHHAEMRKQMTVISDSKGTRL